MIFIQFAHSTTITLKHSSDNSTKYRQTSLAKLEYIISSSMVRECGLTGYKRYWSYHIVFGHED